MRPKFALYLIASTCATISSPAQTTWPAGIKTSKQAAAILKKDAQAITLIEHSLAAGGGILPPEIGVMLSGTLDTGKSSLPLRLYESGSHLTRTEVDQPEGTSIRIQNNGKAVLTSPGGKPKALSTQNTIVERVPYLPTLSLLSDYNSPDTQLEYLGPTTLSNFPVVQVAISWAVGDDGNVQRELLANTRTIFSIDPNTFRVIQMERKLFYENNYGSFKKSLYIYSDYTSRFGKDLPGTITIFWDGKFRSQLKISYYAEGNSYSASTFDLPVVTK